MNRSKYWDIVKGIGIALVVLGHAGCPSLQFAYIFNYFHLAIFFYCSGALYRDTHSNHPIDFFFHKLKTIYIPMMKYIIFFIIMNNVFINFKVYSVTDASGIIAKTMLSPGEIVSNILSAVLTSNYSIELAGAMWLCLPLIVSVVLFSLIRAIALVLTKIENILTVILSMGFFVLGIHFISKGILLRPSQPDLQLT